MAVGHQHGAARVFAIHRQGQFFRQQHRAFGRQRAAGVQPGDFAAGHRRRLRRLLLHAAQHRRQPRRFIQRGGERDVALRRTADCAPNSATTGLPSAFISSITRWRTSGAGGLDTNASTRLCGSAASMRSALMALMPPISPSNPARRGQWRRCPACRGNLRNKLLNAGAGGATTPIDPAGATLANASGAPAMAVPQSGPISPRSRALVFSATSCATLTLSENIITLQPSSSALFASSAAYSPAIEISARLAAASASAVRQLRARSSFYRPLPAQSP